MSPESRRTPKLCPCFASSPPAIIAFLIPLILTDDVPQVKDFTQIELEESKEISEEDKKILSILEKYKTEDEIRLVTKEDMQEVFNYFYPEETSPSEEKEEKEDIIAPFILKTADYSSNTSYYGYYKLTQYKDIDESKNPTLEDLFDASLEEKKSKSYYFTKDEEQKFVLYLSIGFHSIYEEIGKHLKHDNNPFKDCGSKKETTFGSDDDDHINIYDCFKKFVRKETLAEDNKWFCPKCKEDQRATKKIDFFKMPNILVVHLKRFNNNSKIESVVDFPIHDLDISEFLVPSSRQGGDNEKYELFAIANHYGSMGFGHYTAYAKNYHNGRWYDFNDSSVSETSESSLVSSSAYVLFYKKKNIGDINLDEIYNKKFYDYEPEAQKEKEEKEQKEKEDQKEKESKQEEVKGETKQEESQAETKQDEAKDETKQEGAKEDSDE